MPLQRHPIPYLSFILTDKGVEMGSTENKEISSLVEEIFFDAGGSQIL